MPLIGENIVHIHASRLCNLSCSHCYSRSSPQAAGGLSAALLLAATTRLANFGYRNASLSGGEPSILHWVGDLCHGLREQGYRVSLITNGWRVERLASWAAAGLLSQVAVSFDGLPHLHDHIRGRKGSFDRALATAERLVSTGVATGAVVAVTNRSLSQLPELVETLVESGLSHIQFHPICQIGRATDAVDDQLNELGEEALIRLLVLTTVFRELWSDVHFSCDAVLGRDLTGIADGLSGKRVSPLVIDENGELIPLAYGLNRAFSLGNIRQDIQMPRYSGALVRLVADSARRCEGTVATSFFPELVRESQRCGEPTEGGIMARGIAMGRPVQSLPVRPLFRDQ